MLALACIPFILLPTLPVAFEAQPARPNGAGGVVGRPVQPPRCASSDLVDDVLTGAHSIELLKTGRDNFTGTVSSSNSVGNSGVGMFGDETGAGMVPLTNLTFIGDPNALGEAAGTATFVIQP